MPPVTLSEQQFRAASSALTHATHVRMAALTRTPLAGIKASSSTEFLTAWAILGTWTCTRVWPTPDHARWPQACCPINQALAERKPYLGGWARSSFEQGALCALAAMSSQASCTVPSQVTHAFSATGLVPASQIRLRLPCPSSSTITGIRTAFMNWT